MPCILGVSRCLYERSERQLGSQDLGAVVVVEAFWGEASQLQMEGVQFRHVGQAFQQHHSALTVTGNAWMAGEVTTLEVVVNDLKCLPSLAQAGADVLKTFTALRSVDK